MRRLSTVLLVLGVLLLVDGAATLLWAEPVTAVYARVQQDRLEDQLGALERASAEDRADADVRRTASPAPAVAARERAAALRRGAERADALARRTDAGDAIGRIRAPDAGLEAIFLEGTDPGDLRRGPGHYPGTALPGQRGTVAIAGHRTTYGAPFRRLDDLDRGDRIELAMPYGRFAYRVESVRIVEPEDVGVTRRVGYDRLVLTACHPIYSAAQRIVVTARATPLE